ncbi:DUF4949 domain-containing protein [Legionella yabuuchiae]|uniref:DUF4949 domain-containing protein n=1 Tax=Legionella yabuuchiae TaxID=376727 RepID=UPI001056CF00|nr:DUF4949 domain-containing protein [Legionella yabuuchiae]
MKLKTALTTFIGCLAISVSAHAIPFKNPLVCPKVEDIKAGGVVMGYQLFADFYFAINQSRYNTDHNWVFGIGLIDADNEDDALVKGAALLSKLTGNPLPSKLDGDEWGCMYNKIDNQYMAVAVVADDATSPLKLKSFFKKRG